MRVTFRCGHEQKVTATQAAAPVCGECGESVVSRVSGAVPSFRGACAGPYAVTVETDPASVSLAPGGGLVLKAGD